MKYKYEKNKNNYEDFSSGRVLYNASGLTAFPVRLASEIFQRCQYFLKKEGINKPYSLYDPCCGGAYLLTVLGFLHGEAINKIYASDINHTAIEIATKNLSLLNQTGLLERIKLIEQLYSLYSKKSHSNALISASHLQKMLEQKQIQIETTCFQGDISLDLKSQIGNTADFDIIITDIPYGNIAKWQSNSSIQILLTNIYSIVSKQGIVAISADKAQKIKHNLYKRLDYFKVGKRHIAILAPL
jgi:16S rRNA G966 N2-methylase RsmD